MPETGVTIKSRTEGPVHGYTTVYAEVDGGVTGEYLIATGFIGTSMELAMILDMSARRMEAADVTKSGQS